MSLFNVLPFSSSGSMQSLENKYNIFLVGDVGCCKTSLMFQAATSLINDESQTIKLICPSKLTKVPLHVHRMPQLNEKTAKVISILYLSNLQDLIDYICKLFTTIQNLRAILIDNINQYVNPSDYNNEANYKDNLTRLFAILVDTAGHFSNINDQRCQVLVSCDINLEDQASPILKSIASYFFDDIWTIKKSNQSGHSNSFVLLTEDNYNLYYYVEDGQIFLDRVFKKNLKPGTKA